MSFNNQQTFFEDITPLSNEGEAVPTISDESINQGLDEFHSTNGEVGPELTAAAAAAIDPTAAEFLGKWTEASPCKVRILSDVKVKNAVTEAAVATTMTKSVEPQPGGSKLKLLLQSSPSTIIELTKGIKYSTAISTTTTDTARY